MTAEESIRPTKTTLGDVYNNALRSIEKKESPIQEVNNPGEITEEKALDILREVHLKACTEGHISNTIICVAVLLQKGATSSKASGSISYGYGKSIVTIELLRAACLRNKCTTRQLARAMKDEIIGLVLKLDKIIPGNLFKTMSLEVKEITTEESLWASDFQTYNPACPEKVRNWLIKNYRSRFREGS
jgi:hypothetical protein